MEAVSSVRCSFVIEVENGSPDWGRLADYSRSSGIVPQQDSQATLLASLISSRQKWWMGPNRRSVRTTLQPVLIVIEGFRHSPVAA